MTDYISREAFLEQYRSLYCSDCDGRKNEKGKLVYEIGDAPCRACDIGNMLDAVEDFPSADVAPVVHGEWLWFEGCSNSGLYCKVMTPKKKLSTYCPNCGAKMDKLEG